MRWLGTELQRNFQRHASGTMRVALPGSARGETWEGASDVGSVSTGRWRRLNCHLISITIAGTCRRVTNNAWLWRRRCYMSPRYCFSMNQHRVSIHWRDGNSGSASIHWLSPASLYWLQLILWPKPTIVIVWSSWLMVRYWRKARLLN